MFDTHVIARTSADRKNGFGIGSALHELENAGISHAGIIAVCTDMDFAFLPEFCHQVRHISLYTRVSAWAGVELLSIPPALIRIAVEKARTYGAQLVLAHGESIMESIEKGTDFAAIDAGVDILSCPGVLDSTAAALAAERNVCIEISGSPRHAFANAKNAAVCLASGAGLVCGSGACGAEELHRPAAWQKIIDCADCSFNDRNPVLEAIRRSEKTLMQRLQTAEQKN